MYYYSLQLEELIEFLCLDGEKLTNYIFSNNLIRLESFVFCGDKIQLVENPEKPNGARTD